ncbi:MAG: type II toxin-antitoxin system RelE/ParE family toxin [Sedimenticolaceae bacterium]
MSAAYALRELAVADLEAIWVYTAEQWGVEQAERYMTSLFACFEDLAENPQLGRQRDEVKAGYRSFPQGRHVVFYLVVPAGIEVIGIVHQSADVATHLGPPPLSERAAQAIAKGLAELGGSEPDLEPTRRRKTKPKGER